MATVAPKRSTRSKVDRLVAADPGASPAERAALGKAACKDAPRSSHADQNERDYAALRAAVADGRLPYEPEET